MNPHTKESSRIKSEELCKQANHVFCYSFLLRAVLHFFVSDNNFVEKMMILAKNRDIEEFEKILAGLTEKWLPIETAPRDGS